MSLFETLAAPETLPPIFRAWFEAADDAELDALGFAPVGPAETFDLFADRVRRGACASLSYLEENVDARRDPRSVLPSAQTLVVVALSERRLRAESQDATQTLAAEIARIAQSPDAAPTSRSSGVVVPYAACLDYHDVLKRKLKKLRAFFLDRFPVAESRAVVDTAPLLEKDWAVRAGIGFCGLHSLVVSPRLGSRLFLGELLVSTTFADTTGFATPNELRAALAQPEPTRFAERCLRCRRCVDVCPTDAIPGDRTLVANRCLNFWTIENRDALPNEIAEKLDGRLFGCDLCQRVCPWNALENNIAPLDVPLTAVDALDDAEFRRLFKKTPIFRARLDGLKRVADALRSVQTR
jgi:epoxyqueuosine reductase